MSNRDYMHAQFGGGEYRESFWASHRITKSIIVGLAAIHLVTILMPAAIRDPFVGALTMQPDDVLRKFQIWRLFTYAFLHGGLLHLAFNLLGFWFFGRTVEERLGPKKYLWFCGLACVVSALVYIAFELAFGTNIPMFGASGVDMAIIVLVAFWMPRMQVIFFIFPMQLWILAAILVFMDLVNTLEQSSGTAAAAHLGGAFFGFLYFRFSGAVDRIFEKIDDAEERRREKAAAKTARKEAELRKELDRILDKVNAEGMTALTDAEKKFLKDASGKLRR